MYAYRHTIKMFYGVPIKYGFYGVAVNLSVSLHGRVIGLLCVVFASGDCLMIK